MTNRESVDNPEVLRRILTHSGFLLLDFDGPVCSIFAGLPAHSVANQLRRLLTVRGYSELPANVENTSDPFDIFRYAAELSSSDAAYIEAALSAQELEAVGSAIPTHGAYEFISTWHSSGRLIAVVSNNSASAIESYLEQAGYRHAIASISGRFDADPEHLKPSPYLIERVVNEFAHLREGAVMIGDSEADIYAAKAVGATCIGLANKPGKCQRLQEAGADAVTSSMTLLAEVLH